MPPSAAAIRYINSSPALPPLSKLPTWAVRSVHNHKPRRTRNPRQTLHAPSSPIRRRPCFTRPIALRWQPLNRFGLLYLALNSTLARCLTLGTSLRTTSSKPRRQLVAPSVPPSRPSSSPHRLPTTAQLRQQQELRLTLPLALTSSGEVLHTSFREPPSKDQQLPRASQVLCPLPLFCAGCCPFAATGICLVLRWCRAAHCCIALSGTNSFHHLRRLALPIMHHS